jgi:hypothetical protein
MWTTTVPAAEGLKWTLIESISSSPVPRYGMVSTYWAEKDALLIWGGMDEDGNPLNDMWYYPFPSSSS